MRGLSIKAATPTAPACWRRPQFSEADAISCASEASYGSPEDVGVVPIVVPELELGDVEREVLARNLVVVANDPAFHQGPKTLDGVGVDRADDIFLSWLKQISIRISG